MTDTVDWERVRKGVERERGRMVWRPYGLPEILDPEGSAFHDGAIQDRWDIPQAISIQVAITGAFYSRRANPHQPITTSEILDEARACAQAGASAIHLHMRDDDGYNVLDLERFEAVVGPLRDEFPGIPIDGCYVCALDGEWDEMKRGLDRGILDAVPVNTTAVHIGDSLFAKPAPIVLEKTRLVLESGGRPIIAVYADADIDNADRFLFRSGMLGPGQTWVVLPALPGCSPMNTPMQMVDGLSRLSRLISDVDPDARVVVCGAGRASSYLTTVAATLGLHIRVGMEDTVWRWPHRQDKVESNLQAFLSAKRIAEELGRTVAGYDEHRAIMGLPAA